MVTINKPRTGVGREAAEAMQAELILEKNKLRHEIRMVELQTELAEKKLELKRAQEELQQ